MAALDFFRSIREKEADPQSLKYVCVTWRNKDEIHFYEHFYRALQMEIQIQVLFFSLSPSLNFTCSNIWFNDVLTQPLLNKSSNLS